MAGKADLIIEQGATWVLPIDWSTDDETPTPIDLTGYTARMKIRKTDYNGKVLLELTTENEKIVIDDPESGTLEIRVSATETAALFVGTHVYDLELVNGETVTRLLQGSVVVDPEITR